jgi:hypothetical protein
MAQVTHIEDLSDQSFDPYIADDTMFGDIEGPYSILHELRATRLSRRQSATQF